MKTVKEIHEYWENPNDGKNSPYGYISGDERTDFIISIIKQISDNGNDSMLEIGCNVGRNLNGLYLEGYKNLSGIEINKNAVEIMKNHFKKMYNNSNILTGKAEEILPEFHSKAFKMVYTMAVLEHIHKDSEELVFFEIKRICSKYLITIEDECKQSERHFTRNYKDIFENMGFTEIKSGNCKGISGLGRNYNYRIFENGR